MCGIESFSRLLRTLTIYVQRYRGLSIRRLIYISMKLKRVCVVMYALLFDVRHFLCSLNISGVSVCAFERVGVIK